MRIVDHQIFSTNGLTMAWVQENQSLSNKRGILRGLHFQRPPHSETKLVRVPRGAVLDVFVDLRADSPTHGAWDAIELSADRQNMVYLPKGLAHGFCTLSDEAIVLYKVDEFYTPKFEDGLRWNDDLLNIPWPVKDPHLSSKDAQWPLLRDRGVVRL